jgi:hypothetical protein
MTLEELREQHAVLCNSLPFNHFHDGIGADPPTILQAESLIRPVAPADWWGCAPECSRNCGDPRRPSPSTRCAFLRNGFVIGEVKDLSVA